MLREAPLLDTIRWSTGLRRWTPRISSPAPTLVTFKQRHVLQECRISKRYWMRSRTNISLIMEDPNKLQVTSTVALKPPNAYWRRRKPQEVCSFWSHSPPPLLRCYWRGRTIKWVIWGKTLNTMLMSLWGQGVSPWQGKGCDAALFFYFGDDFQTKPLIDWVEA